jgi:hypothetical protein
MPYYLAHKGADEEFPGVPFPAVGTRVVFDAEPLFLARERLMGHPVDRTVTGADGLVVHEDPMDVLTLPDRLWRVDDVAGGVRLLPSDRWFRCRSLMVVEELPNWSVMGPHGDLVARVIDRARELTDERAGTIAAMDPAEEKSVVDAVWRRWLAAHRSGSPIGCGLLALHGAVTDAARRAGPDLFDRDDEAGVEVLADPAWQQAGAAAGAIALALGASDLLDGEERRALSARWANVMGMPGSGR